jgi:PAS domain S-box-containing protein
MRGADATFAMHDPRTTAAAQAKLARAQTSPSGITFHRLISEHASDVASLHGRDGAFVFASTSAARVVGWSEAELRARSLLDCVHDDDRAKVADALKVEGDVTARVTYRFRTASGDYLWVESILQAAAAPGGALIVCTTRDVSRQRRAVRALEEGMLSLAMRSPDAVFLVQEGRILRANPAALERLGVATEAALKGRPYLELVHPDDAPYEGPELARTTRASAPCPVHDIRLIAQDGAPIAAQSYALGVSFDGRDATLVVVRPRLRPDTQAIVADRLRSIGTIAAGLAHELADPIALLLTSLELLGTEDDDEAGRYAKTEALKQARRAGQEVYDALRSLRSLSRGDEDLRRNIDLREVLETVVHLAQARLSTTTRIQCDFDEEPVFAFGDQARVSQALLNVVTNAVDAAGRCDAGEVRIALRAAAKGGAIIEVSDNGEGIDERTLDRVFEPFFTTKPISTASGLGLAISNAIVRSLGGRIALESAPGVGTIVSIQLPAANGQRVPRSGPPSMTIRVSPAPPSSHGLVMPRVVPRGERPRLLVIDDEVALANALRRMFRHEYDVTVEPTAEGAFGRIMAGEEFDLVLCDLQLPGISGIDFYGQIQETAPALVRRIVFVTGGVLTPGTQAFLDARPNLQIDKPFTPTVLRGHLRELLATF